ncbi:uncharacterized protein LOC116412796 [Galleria mellonella]|uniref:Uncharacterized protein LOC116412796 n=1 Tax=Galleria mellonella TaxID=7137 RepID=A0ABM3MZI4_GALME|nr:uncharacterized protein LOC116412796 [Galleria mellonella]
MSKNEIPLSAKSLSDVRVEVLTHKPKHNHGSSTPEKDKRRIAEVSSSSGNYVYVNTAYVGSLNNLTTRSDRIDRLPEPPTSVVREQYWACSKWPFGQRMLAIAVGVLLGTVIALSCIVGLNNRDVVDNLLPGLLRSNPEK